MVKVLLKDVQEHGIFGRGKFDELHSPAKFLGTIASALRHLLVQSMSLSEMTGIILFTFLLSFTSSLILFVNRMEEAIIEGDFWL